MRRLAPAIVIVALGVGSGLAVANGGGGRHGRSLGAPGGGGRHGRSPGAPGGGGRHGRSPGLPAVVGAMGARRGAPSIRDALPASRLQPLARASHELQAQVQALAKSLARRYLGPPGRSIIPYVPGPPQAGTTCFVSGVSPCSLRPLCVEFVAVSGCRSSRPQTVVRVIQSVPAELPAAARLP